MSPETFTTGQVAKICRVSVAMATKWCNTGLLRCFRVPGSRDRRIPREYLRAFMAEHNMPAEWLGGAR